ncbi:MAG TPA: TonB-dependent receptor, partial [Longimicrobiales bacterium]|nr:TonB-dependent receptor [Longimicrobiales bacterium]
SDPAGTGILVGRIIDAERRAPVAEAQVRLVELDRTTLSNARGYFTFGEQPWGVYTLEVSSLGYAPATTGVRVAGSVAQNVEVRLSPDALELEGLTVTADARLGRQIEGMVRRMSFGAGDFITRDIIERRPGAAVADFLQEVPGMTVRRGLYGQVQMEVRGRACTPDVFVDGNLYSLDPVSGLDFYAGELEAVEVYRGIQVPGEFLRPGRVSYPCAVIAVWTRRGFISPGGG